jgi:anion-transporting  ArsA/GET3 family ATPase
LDPLNFFSQARLFVVTGKGGVGKTTVCGVMANLAARQGLSSLVVQLGTPGVPREPGTGYLARLFGREEVLDYEAVLLVEGAASGGVRARALRPDTALVEYLHQHGMRRLSRRLASSGALDVVATAVPGMPDMLVLGKLKQMERAAAQGQPDAPDVIVLDAPAAGHAVRFLQSPRGLLDAAGGGPVRAQAQEVVQMLADPSRCQVFLVTTPDETPVTEAVETARLLEGTSGVKLGGVVVNAMFPPLDLPAQLSAKELIGAAEAAGAPMDYGSAVSLLSAWQLRRQRQASQAAQVSRLARELPLPQFELPFCFSGELGPGELETLTNALGVAIAGWAPAVP